MRWFLASVLVLVQTISAIAQDDKDRITLYLENALSEHGREVQIQGFQGALSSRATMELLTFADEDGVWLTLKEVVFDWNRASILRGRIEIREISATRIDLPRLPVSNSPANPEAGTFALPDLPVSLRIDVITVGQAVLGDAVVGVPVVASITGSMSLANGEGEATLDITRLEGPRGSFKLDADYSNQTRILSVDLSLDEAANGISANILDLPNRPAMELTIKGSSRIDDFQAALVLRSDGQDRLTGRIATQTLRISEEDENTVGAAPSRLINADIAGDLAPLFASQYRDFFGSNVALKSRISLFADGRTALDDLSINSAALRLAGSISLSADRLPEQFSLNIKLQDPNGDLVFLPLSGTETSVKSATINADFDENQGDTWSLIGDFQNIKWAEGALDHLAVTAGGRIKRGETRHVTADIKGSASGLAFADPALTAALGTSLSVGGDVDWHDGRPLDVTNFILEGPGFALSGDGTVGGLDGGFVVDGKAAANVETLSRFSQLFGQSITGGLSTEIDGQATFLTGAFDLVLDAVATDIGVGVANVDAVFFGQSRLGVSIKRDTTGLTLRSAKLVANGGQVEAAGQMATGDSDVQLTATIKDIGQFIDNLNGPAQLTGRAIEDGVGWALILDAKAPNETTVAAQIALPIDAPIGAKFKANFGSVAWIVPNLIGPAHIRGTAFQDQDKWAVDARADGPSGTTMVAKGHIARDASRASLGLSGSLPLSILNRQLSPNSLQGISRFDLRLDGPLSLSSLNGQAQAVGARLTLASSRNALTDIDATVKIAADGATVQANSNVASGGKLNVKGRVALQSPFSADLEIQLNNARLIDPNLYETTVSGPLKLSGSAPAHLALSGQLVLDRTEIRVPSTGAGTSGAIPDIVHLNEPSVVRRTRSYAGLLVENSGAGSGGSTAIALDLQIIAGNRIFVRGRGLDAQLGGQLRLTGTTADVQAQGGFDLVRGRLDILGKRLTLEEGSARLEGDLNPTLRLVARTNSDDIVIFVFVEGAADAPEIQFVSEPELPEDEILAQLLFGHDITSLSPFQAVQLASAVATLAGRGGVGIIEMIRQNTGFDDLDLTTNSQGETALGVGKYINQNAYSNIQIDSQGQSSITLNLDLTPSTKLRGQAGSDGSTGIGLFFETDY